MVAAVITVVTSDCWTPRDTGAVVFQKSAVAVSSRMDTLSILWDGRGGVFGTGMAMQGGAFGIWFGRSGHRRTSGAGRVSMVTPGVPIKAVVRCRRECPQHLQEPGFNAPALFLVHEDCARLTTLTKFGEHILMQLLEAKVTSL